MSEARPVSRKVTVKVVRNHHGNYRGHATGRDSVQLGDSEFLAREWAREVLEQMPGATFNSEMSDIALD